MQNGDEASSSIILAGWALLVKMLITLEPRGIFTSNFVYLCTLTLSDHCYAKRWRGFADHHFGQSNWLLYINYRLCILLSVYSKFNFSDIGFSDPDGVQLWLWSDWLSARPSLGYCCARQQIIGLVTVRLKCCMFIYMYHVLLRHLRMSLLWNQMKFCSVLAVLNEHLLIPNSVPTDRVVHPIDAYFPNQYLSHPQTHDRF